MRAFIFRRILALVPVMFGISLITFCMMYVLPGDPALMLAGERADEEIIAGIRSDLGLDRNIGIRYLEFLGRILKGDLGKSMITGQSVASEIASKLPNTFVLAATAIFVAAISGIAAGMIAAIYRGRLPDRIVMMLSLAGISTPVFFSGMVGIYLFSVTLGILPASGMGGGPGESGLPSHLILPALTLGLRSGAVLARITRTSMIDVLGRDFVLAARARGIPSWRVYARHCLKNAMIPVITVMGLDFSSYLNGSVITETIFSWPGIGRYVMMAITKRDLPVITSCILVCAVIFVTINLAVDIAYGFLNPKMRIGEATGGRRGA